MTSVCRICLVGNTALHTVKNNLRRVYENLTNTKFNCEDARPRAVCCYCHQKLLRCLTFSQMALRSEKMFSHLYDNGLEVTHDYLSEFNVNMKQHLSFATMQFITIDHHYAGSQVSIKDEPQPCIDTTEEVTTESDCTRTLLTLEEDDAVQENDTEELLDSIPVEQPKSDESMTFICNSCNKIFDMKSKIISHIANAHPRLQYSYTRKRSVTTSKNEDNIPHNIKKRFARRACGKNFYKSGLNRHLITHTGEKPFACDVCDKQFTQKSSLVSHMRIHTGERPFTCNVCDKQYNQKSILVTHMRIHSGLKTFACNVCGKQFNQKSNLFVHMKTHSGEKPFACNVCGKQFNRKGNLVTHVQTHSRQTPFACNICGIQFHSQTSLFLHKKAHLGEKPFACNECGKQFTQKSNLLRHIKIHMRDKPFATHILKSQPQHTVKHARKTSMNEDKILRNVKKFPCHICDKKYKSNHLARHLITHTGEKPFACNVCDKQFNQKINLERHMGSHLLYNSRRGDQTT